MTIYQPSEYKDYHDQYIDYVVDQLKADMEPSNWSTWIEHELEREAKERERDIDIAESQQELLDKDYQRRYRESLTEAF